MWLSAALDPVSVFAAGIVSPSASLLWRVLCESWCTYQQGCTVTPLGQVWFAGTRETTCWAASGFMPWVLSAGCGNGVESCLVACNSWCWGGTVVRTGKEGGSVCSLKSPFFICLLPHQILLHLCGVRSILCCISAYPGLRNGRGKNHKTEQEPWEIFPSPAWVGVNEHQSSAFAKRYWLFSTVQYLSLLTNSIFYL